jgi:hypothetical protein
MIHLTTAPTFKVAGNNDDFAVEREGSLTALIVSPLTADHRWWQIEVVIAKVLRHDGMIMTRRKNCQVRLPD